jgi:predicted hydrocarbon binding protein
MTEPLNEKSGELQGMMVFLASLSHGLESTLGRGATTITFRAGRSIGLKEKASRTTSDPIEALQLLGQKLGELGIDWPFEVWQKQGASTPFYEKDGKKALRLVFHHCMVRCSLFRYAHEQKLSLCMMNHGLFCGYLQNILGKKVDLDIVHAGDSACLKELVITE